MVAVSLPTLNFYKMFNEFYCSFYSFVVFIAPKNFSIHFQLLRMPFCTSWVRVRKQKKMNKKYGVGQYIHTVGWSRIYILIIIKKTYKIFTTFISQTKMTSFYWLFHKFFFFIPHVCFVLLFIVPGKRSIICAFAVCVEIVMTHVKLHRETDKIQNQKEKLRK